MALELAAKRLELLKEAIPGIARVGLLANGSNPVFATLTKQTEAAARSLRIELLVLDVRKPEQLARAFDSAVRQRIDALHISIDAFVLENFRKIVELAAKHRSTLRNVCGSNLQGREAGRSSHRATHQIPARHQPCVQRKLTCSAGGNLARVKARAL